MAEYTIGRGNIEVDLTRRGFDVADGDIDNMCFLRRGTVLHETVHPYLDQLTCRSCPAFGESVENMGGHGRAFQLLLAALEVATERLLGVRLRVGSIRTLRGAGSNFAIYRVCMVWRSGNCLLDHGALRDNRVHDELPACIRIYM